MATVSPYAPEGRDGVGQTIAAAFSDDAGGGGGGGGGNDHWSSPAAPFSTASPLPGVRERAHARRARQASTDLAMADAHRGRMSSASEPAAPRIGIGVRVLIRAVDADGKQLLRTGVVRFEGATQFAKGLWVGVELTCATGKNDGAVKGQRYFQCRAHHGVFVRPHMVVVAKKDRAFRQFTWDDLLVAEVQGRGVITIDGDDVADDAYGGSDDDDQVAEDLNDIAATIARLSSARPPPAAAARGGTTGRPAAGSAVGRVRPAHPPDGSPVPPEFMFMQQDNFLRRAQSSASSSSSAAARPASLPRGGDDARGSASGAAAPSEEDRRRAEELLRDSKRLVAEGLLSEEDFEEIKLRAMGAFIWQRGGPSGPGGGGGGGTSPGLLRALRASRGAAASAQSGVGATSSSGERSNALSRRRDEIARALRDAEGGDDGGSSRLLPAGTEGCCPIGHPLQPYLPPKSLMASFPGRKIHFAADGTTAQQAALRATRQHVLAFGEDYTRDWDFLTLPNCSSCGADLHGGQASFRCPDCTEAYLECSSCYHRGSALWALVPVEVQGRMLKLANQKRDQAVVRELLQVPVQHRRRHR